ncbi:threonine transporter RhtB [bacterium SCN 62-11]|nr:LysE family translocator [Candidatus Eremiobacteraeota bacterium]ODT56946.1 MAG: threonine transporter RhtB [bacterium SCN 62-11]
MIPSQTLLNFTGTALVLAALPGPDSLFVLSQSALRGPRAGLILTLGLCTGLICYSIAVAFGVAAIFQTSPLAFRLLKGTGTAYLLYLAWSAYRASPSETETPQANAAYLRGLLMNLSNPKVAIFFLAFLPQFTSPAWGSLTLQLLTLGALMVLSTLLVFSLFSLLAGRLSTRLRRSEHNLNRIASLIFTLLAGKLAFS